MKIIVSFYSVVCFASLVFGFQYGEGLLSQEWITRLDYLVLFFSGLMFATSLSLLLTLSTREENRRGGF